MTDKDANIIQNMVIIIKMEEVRGMNYYIIEDTTAFTSSYDSHMLVKAANKKEALDKMWIALGYDDQEKSIRKGYEARYKKEFTVTQLDEWFEKKRYKPND